MSKKALTAKTSNKFVRKTQKAKSETGKANASGKASRKHSTQRLLEDAILRRCAAGRDQLDKKRVPGVTVIPVKPGTTDCKDFPRAWSRKESSGRKARGAAEWYVPPGANPARRMLFLHGGSYILWAPQDAPYRALCTRLAKACNICILSVDYRMAPEHLFPAAFDDSLAALRWITSHGPFSTTETSPAEDVFVCGDSAGGGLALAVCLALEKSFTTCLRGVIGLSAWTDLTASTGSYDTRQWDAERCFGDAVNATTDRRSGREEAEGYLGRGGVQKHGRDWRASPFFAPAAKLRRLPSVLLHVGDYELILDESVDLHRRMQRAGHLDATVSVYSRMWHCWHEYTEGGGEGQSLKKAVDAIREIGRWVRDRFQK
eukprot:TRINITY_DN8529_c0_g2_i1.p1 TRINITY_DN8529_c0_g2~~TRINITY_DN8529_c0_g2_i1.p1  ORF type:complete len:374 (-),score=81.11 TRINITY_DN8529_c0_g2_i1:370-1491(-)